MVFLFVIALAYLSAFLPLVIAFAMKVRRVGRIVATILSLGILAAVSFVCHLVLVTLGVEGSWWPIAVGTGFGLLGLIGGCFLFATSDENNE